MTEVNGLQSQYDAHENFVSDKWELYISVYNPLLCPLRDLPVNLLEIGVQNGGSLEIWSKFFAKAANIVGYDINPHCERLEYSQPNIYFIIGDVNQPETRALIAGHSEKSDIVIDDRSHFSSDIIKSFCMFFSKINYDGMYIAEDLHCSYWAGYEGGLNKSDSCMAFFKALSDIVNYEHWGLPITQMETLASFCLTPDITEDLLAEVASVGFHNSLCIVRRKPALNNGLGRRVIAGDKELVVSVKNLHGSRSQAPLQRLASFNADGSKIFSESNEVAVTYTAKNDKKDFFFTEQAEKIKRLEAKTIRLNDKILIAETQLAQLREQILQYDATGHNPTFIEEKTQ